MLWLDCETLRLLLHDVADEQFFVERHSLAERWHKRNGRKEQFTFFLRFFIELQRRQVALVPGTTDRQCRGREWQHISRAAVATDGSVEDDIEVIVRVTEDFGTTMANTGGNFDPQRDVKDNSVKHFYPYR